MGRNAFVVKVSVAIMAVPPRMPAVQLLKTRLGSPSVPVVIDEHREGSWPTSRRAWLQYDRESDYHMVLQDDVWPCDRFVEVVPLIIGTLDKYREAPGPVGFYANRKVIEEAEAQGSSWAVIPDGIWGQCSCLPTSVVERYVGWADAHLSRMPWTHDDSRLALWCLENNCPVYCTVPSLVQHAGNQLSLTGHTINNTARRFIGDADPFGIDWARGLPHPPKGPNGISRSYYQYFDD